MRIEKALSGHNVLFFYLLSFLFVGNGDCNAFFITSWFDNQSWYIPPDHFVFNYMSNFIISMTLCDDFLSIHIQLLILKCF